jgi:hypothetical protein
MHRTSAATIAFIASLLGTCGTTTATGLVSAEPALQDTNSSCASLAGLYVDDATQEASKSKLPTYPSLAGRFNASYFHLRPVWLQRVTELAFPRDFDGVEINGYAGSEKVITRRVPFDSRYRCVNGQLVITFTNEGHTEGRTYSIRYVTTLSGGDGRALTGHDQTSGYSRYLFIPYSENSEKWYQFERIK